MFYYDNILWLQSIEFFYSCLFAFCICLFSKERDKQVKELDGWRGGKGLGGDEEGNHGQNTLYAFLI